jgi:hypothetical protein
LALNFTESQKAFVFSQEPFPAFVGGFGSGKTAAGIARIMRLKRYCPYQDVAYYLPTYPLIEDIAFQRFPALFEKNGIPFKLNQQKAVMETELGRIIFRNMEQPDRIVGYEVAHSVVDELDTLPIDKARAVWNKIIARNRQKAFTVSGKPVRNTVGVATTPEGFRFVYDRWVKNKAEGYALYRAKTADNAANLPEDYIKNLQNSYSSSLLAAYLDGEFVNLTAGSVYPEFDRKLNYTLESILPREPLHIGLDFNVNNMSAIVCVIRNNNPLALDELTGVRDTPTMIRALLERYQGHPITVYPDASGGATKSVNASLSDITLLRSANFTVLAPSKNPAVKDRVMAVNQIIHNQGVRRLLVNPDKCPNLIEGLERQAYNKSGEPDKTAGLDHLNDAIGYLIAYKYGIGRGTVSFAQIAGV